jgi:hypothetical protein
MLLMEQECALDLAFGSGIRDAGVDGGEAAEGPGALVGRYKLLERIGGGGMGVVYMAEQVRPVRRRVALKIIKPGMDSKQVIARFEAGTGPGVGSVVERRQVADGKPLRPLAN